MAGHKARVVPNGIDTERFRDREGAAALRESLGIAPGAPVVGTVGRLDEVKCQDLLIRGFARALGRAPGARLLLVGDGPRRPELEGLVESLGLGGSAIFAGYQARPDRYLQAMDVFALTSRAEGMPLAILEAWAAGLPVIATRVGGVPRLVDHGRTGWLIGPGDEPGLVDALGGLLAEPGRARALGLAGRDRAVADFDTRRMARDYHENYLELLGPRRARTPCAS